MYSPDTDPANTTYRERLEMSGSYAEQAANGLIIAYTGRFFISNNAADLSNLDISRGDEETDRRIQAQGQMHGPLRMVSATGPGAKDITVEFSTAASGTSVIPCSSKFLTNNSSIGDRTAC